MPRNDNDSALAILEKARARISRKFGRSSALRRTYCAKEEPDAALRLVDDFRRRHWWHYQAALRSGRLLRGKRRRGSFRRAFRFASWLDVHDAEAFNLLSLAFVFDRIDWRTRSTSNGAPSRGSRISRASMCCSRTS